MVGRLREGLFLSLAFSYQVLVEGRTDLRRSEPSRNESILILGGGMTGVIAARTLHERGYDNFIIVEARDELGGRMQTQTIGGNWTVERGPNWVQGTQTDDGPVNPILVLTQKHNVSTQFNDLFDSLCKWFICFLCELLP